MSNVEKLPVRRPRNAAATRSAIVEAASRLFAKEGYEQVGVRDIAAEAGVDPALVNRYFGSKEGLLVAVLEALVGGPPAFTLPRGEIGPAVARWILAWEGEGSRDQLMALDMAIRSTNSPTARAVVREDVETRFVAPIVERLGGGADAEVRALLFNAIVMGASVVRGLLGDRAAMRPHLDEMIAYLGPILERLLDPAEKP